MNAHIQEHCQRTIDQFTRQAVPFALWAQMPHHMPDLAELVGVTPEDTVLDVACGPGAATCDLATIARQAMGIDITPAMIEQARELQSARGLTNVTWLVAEVPPLPLPEASFSFVFTRYSLHHFLQPQAVVDEMVRVCAPGGRVAVMDMFMNTAQQAASYDAVEILRDPSHVRTLLLDELAGLFDQAGLHEVQTSFHRLPMELEKLLGGSFPGPGDDQRIRLAFEEELERNQMGLDMHREEGAIHFAYPIAVLVGRKP